jgi:hypothetical protein
MLFKGLTMKSSIHSSTVVLTVVLGLISACGKSRPSVIAAADGGVDKDREMDTASEPAVETSVEIGQEGRASSDTAASDQGQGQCGCARAPVCGEACQGQCGCCTCIAGESLTIGNDLFRCSDTMICYQPVATVDASAN